MDREIINLDLIIIGGGPAGLTAAVYAARAKMKMLLFENPAAWRTGKKQLFYRKLSGLSEHIRR